MLKQYRPNPTMMKTAMDVWRTGQIIALVMLALVAGASTNIIAQDAPSPVPQEPIPQEVDDLLKSLAGESSATASSKEPGTSAQSQASEEKLSKRQSSEVQSTPPAVTELPQTTTPRSALSSEDNSVDQIPDPFDDGSSDKPAEAEASSDSLDFDNDLLGEISAANRQGERIELLSGYENALRLAKVEQRPILVVLGAEWCSWCRKLESELATPEADGILKQWIVVKVDVDDEPEVAEQLAANALPALRVLALDQSLIASSEGYQPIPELEKWLGEHRGKADPAVQRILYETTAPTRSTVEELIVFMGDRNANFRAAACARLRQSPTTAGSLVVDALRTGSLSQQLCAMELLSEWGAPIGSLDPWQPESLSAEATEPLVNWVRTLKDDEQVVAPEESAATDVEGVRGAVTQLLKADGPLRRNGAMLDAARLGEQVLPELRRLIAEPEGLNDSQIELLRETLYRTLAGPRTQLNQAALLSALASLQAETHREAADEFLAEASSDDQPLVDELSRDLDPLVREMAVTRLSSIGALMELGRFERLLNDDSPSVRTAVLRELEEVSNKKAVKALISYLEKESDEDLLVYATKTLGKVEGEPEAEAALIRLAGNSAWRVRAAALDSIEAICESSGDSSPFGNSPKNVSADLAKCVITAVRDEDEFVNAKAIKLLPQVISAKSATVLCEFLAEHPEHLESLSKDLSEYEINERFAPLIAQASKWMKSDASTANEKRIAVLILAKYEPTGLQDKLAELILSDDQAVSIAALQGTLATFNSLRAEQVEDDFSRWHMSRAEKKELQSIPAWNPVPAWFEAPPTHEKSLDSEADESLEEQASSSNNSLWGSAFQWLAGGSDTAEPNVVRDPFEDSATPVDIGDPFAAGAESDLDQPFNAASTPVEVPDLDIADSFFGMDASDATVETTTVAETNDASGEKEIAAVAEDVELSDLHERIRQMLGDSEVPLDTDEINDKSNESEVSLEQASLPSFWLARWQKNQGKRVKWVEEVRDSLRQLDGKLSSAGVEDATSKRQRAWVDAVLLALGSSDEKLLGRLMSIESSEASGLPQAEDVLPWLSSTDRKTLIQRLEMKWEELGDGKTHRSLQAATVIDDLLIAEWLLTTLANIEPMDASRVQQGAELLLRSRMGIGADNLGSWMDASGFDGKTAFWQANEVDVPGKLAALQWFGEKYAKESSSNGRALLLVALAKLDHRLATESAVGLLAGMSDPQARVPSDLELEVASHIAFCDLKELAADRAAQLLGSTNELVRSKAIERLLTTSYNYTSNSSFHGIERTYDYEDEIPGLGHMFRTIPVETLESLRASKTELHRNVADLLELSQGNMELDPHVVAESLESEQAAVLVVVALTKAKRVDGKALIYYRAVAKELQGTDEPDIEQGAIMYRQLRRLEGSEISALRSEMRRDFGTEILN